MRPVFRFAATLKLAGRGIVDFGAGKKRCDGVAVLATGSQDLSVIEQRCREKFAGCLHATGNRESTGHGVAQLRACQVIPRRVDAARNQGLAVRQESSGVAKARRIQAARETESAGRGIVEFRGRNQTICIDSRSLLSLNFPL